MTSVSHPLIADIAHARSSNRPDAPAREPRREDEKFSVPEAPQTAKERNDIPDAPVAPVAPVAPRDNHPPATPDTPAAATKPVAETVPEANTADTARSVDTAASPATPAEPSPGLIAGIAAGGTGNGAAGQAATATAQVNGAQNTSTTAAAGQPSQTQANPPAADGQAAAGTQQQTGGATSAAQANQPAVPTGAAATAPGAPGTQAPAAATQIVAAANVGRTGPGGTPQSGTTTSDPKTAVAKNALLDQQSGEVESTGSDAKKPTTAFTTGVSTAAGATDTAAKPPVPQANTQILAQAMANAPAIAAATPEPTPPSLTGAAPITGDTLGVTQSFNAEMRAAINSPTQAAAYTARGAVTAQPAVEQIAMQITRAADQNIDRMTVHLKPAELGKVTIDLEVGPDNRMLAVISAERSETLDLLQRDAKSLEKALNDAGVKTDSGSLEFNLKGEGGMAENGRDGDGKFHDGAVMLPGDIDAVDVNGAPTNTPLILPEGRIDIQV